MKAMSCPSPHRARVGVVEPHPDQHLDPRIATTYDDRVSGWFDPDVLEPTVDVLAELADGGTALELAIGTGRVALPLAARGVEVHGIDLSEPMVAELRAKPGGADIPVTIGDMTSTVVGDGFSLAYLVFNTIGNVTTQDGQLACFRSAAQQLAPGGRFVVEVGVPQLAQLAPGERTKIFDLSDEHVGVDEYVDPVGQVFVSHHWYFDGGRVHRVAGHFRWVWPSELDLMARVAGMSLEHRWADWRRTPFTAESRRHVSIWRLGDGPD